MMKNWLQIHSMNQNGAVLITLILAILVTGLAGGGMLYYSTTSTYGELLANRQQQAYYLAETGINYARYLFDPNESTGQGPFPSPETFTLSNGQFRVETYEKATDETRLVIESTGVVGTGWLTTRQHVYKEISKAEVSGSTGVIVVDDDGEEVVSTLGFNEVDSEEEELDTTWQVVETATSDVIVNEDGEMQFKGSSGEITLNPDLVNLYTAWENNGELLGYFLQTKIDITKMSPGKYYMIGISFRILNADAQDSYGLSFYRSNGTNGPKDWYRTSEFEDLTDTLPTDGSIHVVLWKRINGYFTVLASAQVDGYTYGLLNPDGVLAQWATLVVRVNEKFDSGTSGSRNNYITAYVQNPSLYPEGTINWNFNNFKQILWTWPTQKTDVVDSTFTSENFTTTRPEIGVHAFYDSSAMDAQFFADFSTVVQGLGSGGTQW